MNTELINKIVQRLVLQGYVSPQKAESTYPVRQLPANAQVTRIAPSPTGLVHIGNIYAALLNERLAHVSGGVYFMRIEDTDKQREVAGGQELLISALAQFGLDADESPVKGGNYGPYVQSQRAQIYLGYALSLLSSSRAYPCFATKEELKLQRDKQTADKIRPGYYGKYAVWRDRPAAEVATELESGKPFVLRFKSMGDHGKRIDFHDQLKGDISLPQNDLDVPLIKSDGLPTYHLAHVVDDHLMRTSVVMRGEEWLPSTPLHIELSQTLGLPVLNYAHLAPISIMDGKTKRKLSKRKDEAADVGTWLDSGYSPIAIIEYLMRLANSNYEEWRLANPTLPYTEFPFTLEKLAASRAPLLDMQKLHDVSRETIATMNQASFEQQLLDWLRSHDDQLYKCFTSDPKYTSKILAVERQEANHRKDLGSWSEARDNYSYFFEEFYRPKQAEAVQELLGDIQFIDQKAALEAFLETFDTADDQPTWLQKMRDSAAKAGFSPDTAAYKAHPETFKGSLADFAKILRVNLTGRNKTPDLYSVMQAMGLERVRQRLGL